MKHMIPCLANSAAIGLVLTGNSIVLTPVAAPIIGAGVQSR